jgi:hypothetical protein
MAGGYLRASINDLSPYSSDMKRFLFLVVALVAVVISVAQQKAIGRVKAERQTLLADSAEAARLEHENAAVAQLPDVDAQVKALRPNQRELARLRNEMSNLRSKAAETEKLRIVNQRLVTLQSNLSSGVMPSGFISRSQLLDAGMGTPEATVQTTFYAMTQGNVRRMMQCMGAPQSQLDELTPEDETRQSEMMRHESEKFPGYFISDTNIVSPDEVNLSVRSVPGGVVYPVHLVRIGGVWIAK